MSSIIWQLTRSPVMFCRVPGGIRKLRWSAQGKGKGGDVRVIYYYHDNAIPLFLLTVFGKGQKANVSKAERNELARFTNLLRKHYGGTNG